MRGIHFTATVPTALALAATLTACAPEVATDPVPEEVEFDPARGRSPEPTFAVVDPTTGKIDLSIAGIDVPSDCPAVGTLPQAQCEFNQYLESLDGFPTTSVARAPISSDALELASLPGNVVVIEARTQKIVNEVTVAFDRTTRRLEVIPWRPWPNGAFIWIGVRGYGKGVQVDAGPGQSPKPLVASVPTSLLKRDDSLTCGHTRLEDIPTSCPYYQLFSRQMSDAAARASLSSLERLRWRMSDDPLLGLRAWSTVATLGSIPKDDAAVVWGFPVHSAPVIDLVPPTVQPMVVGRDEVRLLVSGAVDPATVAAYRIGEVTPTPGTVFLINVAALMAPMPQLAAAFPKAQASFANSTITIKADQPLAPGDYAVFASRGIKSPTGAALVPPPVSAFLISRGALVDGAGKSQVTALGGLEAQALEPGRLQLQQLLDSQMFVALTGLERKQIAYVFSVKVSP